jgi:hypothetical protein
MQCPQPNCGTLNDNTSCKRCVVCLRVFSVCEDFVSKEGCRRGTRCTSFHDVQEMFHQRQHREMLDAQYEEFLLKTQNEPELSTNLNGHRYFVIYHIMNDCHDCKINVRFVVCDWCKDYNRNLDSYDDYGYTPSDCRRNHDAFNENDYELYGVCDIHKYYINKYTVVHKFEREPVEVCEKHRNNMCAVIDEMQYVPIYGSLYKEALDRFNNNL